MRYEFSAFYAIAHDRGNHRHRRGAWRSVGGGGGSLWILPWTNGRLRPRINRDVRVPVRQTFSRRTGIRVPGGAVVAVLYRPRSTRDDDVNVTRAAYYGRCHSVKRDAHGDRALPLR